MYILKRPIDILLIYSSEKHILLIYSSEKPILPSIQISHKEINQLISFKYSISQEVLFLSTKPLMGIME